MQIDTKQLADDIAKVMELDKHRTKGQCICASPLGIGFIDLEREEDGWIIPDVEHDYPYFAAAPLMIDIIKRQRELLAVARKALESCSRDVYELCYDQCLVENALALLRKDNQ